MSERLSRLAETKPIFNDAAEWRLIGLLFERPRPGWYDEVCAVAREIDEPELCEAARRAASASESAYLRLFGPGGSVSPREVRYRDYRDPGQLLADLRGFYSAFSFAPAAEDPIDHVAVEAGFLGYLSLKLAFALENGLELEASTTRSAIDRFERDHLGTFIGTLADRLRENAEDHLSQAARVATLRIASRGRLSDETPRVPGAPPVAHPDGCGGCTLPDELP